MTIKKLFKMLSIMTEVYSSKWYVVMAIVDSINNDKSTTVVEKEWFDEYKQKHPEYYPLNLDDIKVWSTYDDKCIDLRFTCVKGKLNCDVMIYDGDNFDGHRTKLRFTAKIILPNAFINHIKGNIEYKFRNFLEEQYDNYLYVQKQKWILNRSDELLN